MKLGGRLGPAKLWLLADYLMSPKLQDALADIMVGLARTQSGTPCPESTTMAYDRTTERSMIRKLLVAIYVSRGTRKQFANDRIHHCLEFALDFAEAVQARRYMTVVDRENYDDLGGEHSCRFHVHDVDKPCEHAQAD
ncbi:hypothetical protein LTR56_019765 [Elasticomyces elasticus]|nr:hypothetical protein LTR56_019765 [Elasticomyces elasticus]KAK3642561.1 hypothetical protein LTR22_015999 [Elasticomyces elasticus]KAK4911303.1 hypothetical protein LTR49_020123 [Elasticomyces elasticus]KAK5745031.1 hypothetical protein LTS12_023267 [Elasticomyces elasticus]